MGWLEDVIDYVNQKGQGVGAGIYDLINRQPNVDMESVGSPEYNLTPETSPDIPRTAFGKPFSLAPKGSAFNPITFNPVEWDTRNRDTDVTRPSTLEWRGSTGVIPQTISDAYTAPPSETPSQANVQLPSQPPSAIPRKQLYGSQGEGVGRKDVYGSFTTESPLPSEEVKSGGLKSVGTMSYVDPNTGKQVTRHFYEPDDSEAKKEEEKISKFLDTAVKHIGYDPRTIDPEKDAERLADRRMSSLNPRQYTPQQWATMRMTAVKEAYNSLATQKNQGMQILGQFATQFRNEKKQEEDIKNKAIEAARKEKVDYQKLAEKRIVDINKAKDVWLKENKDIAPENRDQQSLQDAYDAINDQYRQAGLKVENYVRKDEKRKQQIRDYMAKDLGHFYTTKSGDERRKREALIKAGFTEDEIDEAMSTSQTKKRPITPEQAAAILKARGK